MEIYQLYSIIQQELAQAGFGLIKVFRNSMEDSHFCLGYEFQEGTYVSNSQGCHLEVYQVYRSNGTLNNKSYKIAPCYLCQSSSTTIGAVTKLSCRDSEKKIRRLVQAAVESYRQIIANR